MARQSESGHVRKICGCTKWKECSHPWYVSYREGKRETKNGTVREDGIRGKLSKYVGREPVDFADAKAEARRAIVAWQDGRDARTLLPGDVPTLTQVLDGYAARPVGAPLDKWQRGRILKTLVAGRPFGEYKAEQVTRETIEVFRAQRPRVAGNRDLALLRAAFNWAVLQGVVATTPFKVGTVSAVKLPREEPRTRRLQYGEEERLLAACEPGTDNGGRPWAGNPDLRALIIAALETGCRLGELLTLQWHQVRGDYLFLPAGKTKARKPRRVGISAALRPVLDARRLDPAGEKLPPDAFVFGDAVGRPRQSIKTAWTLTCKRAKIADLHFHDLRREAASRWMEVGASLVEIQMLLGHHNISQTSTYLGAVSTDNVDVIRRLDQRRGRLPQVAVTAGSDGSQVTTGDMQSSENAQENVIVH
jgi:integrase